MKKKTSSLRTVTMLGMVLFAATWLLYANSLSNQFAFDDKSLVTDNRFLLQGTTLRQIFSTNYRAGSGFTGDGLYRPLIMLTYVWNSGESLNPLPFHFFNVTLNALNSTLLFLFLLAVTGSLSLAFFAGLIFGFHPVHTEAVANIAGRPEIMYAFFLLLAWIITERFRERLWGPALTSVLFFAALLSKETAVMFPLMALSLDIARGRPLMKRHNVWLYSLLVVMTVGYLLIRWNILGSTAAGLDPAFTDNPIAHASFVERTATAFGVFVRYLFLLIFPLRLSADYSFNQVPVISSYFHPLTFFGVLLTAGIAGTVFHLRKRSVLPVLAATLFFFPYLLVSNLAFPVGTIMGERLLYLPVAGYSVFAAVFLTYMFLRRKIVSFAVLALVLGLFTVRTVSRNREWHDDITLFTADLSTTPNSVKVLCNMGFLVGKTGRLEESMSYFRRALEILPDYEEALRGYGRRLYDLKRYRESAEYYAKAIHSSPNNPETHIDYGIVLQRMGEYTAAERELREAARLDPSNPLPYQELSSVLIARENYAGALDCLKRAAMLGGDERVILNNSAAAQFLSGNVNAAYELVNRAESRGIKVNENMAMTIRDAVKNLPVR